MTEDQVKPGVMFYFPSKVAWVTWRDRYYPRFDMPPSKYFGALLRVEKLHSDGCTVSFAGRPKTEEDFVIFKKEYPICSLVSYRTLQYKPFSW